MLRYTLQLSLAFSVSYNHHLPLEAPSLVFAQADYSLSPEFAKPPFKIVTFLLLVPARMSRQSRIRSKRHVRLITL